MSLSANSNFEPQLNTKAINPSPIVNRSQAEQAIYVEIIGDSRFPAITSIQYDYPDTSEAFPDNTHTAPASSAVIYPKFATLNYIINPEDLVLGQDGFVTLTTAQTAYGSFNALQIVSAAVFDGLSAVGSTVNALTGTSIPAGIIYGPYTGVAVHSGIVIAYNV